jgi:hypothetical protein
VISALTHDKNRDLPFYQIWTALWQAAGEPEGADKSEYNSELFDWKVTKHSVGSVLLSIFAGKRETKWNERTYRFDQNIVKSILRKYGITDDNVDTLSIMLKTSYPEWFSDQPTVINKVQTNDNNSLGSISELFEKANNPVPGS